MKKSIVILIRLIIVRVGLTKGEIHKYIDELIIALILARYIGR